MLLVPMALVLTSMLAFASPSAWARGLGQPALQTPGNNASVQSLPTFEWASVPRATTYQFEFAADSHFGAIVSHGSFETHNTAATLDTAMPDGMYYWRVRAITAQDTGGPWSRVRRLVKRWTSAPTGLSPNGGATINWPTQPLVLSWGSVPYAVKYLLTVATDPQLGNQVLGSASNPVTTQGTVYSPGTSLTPGTYFWAVTPLDAAGHKGTRSAVGTFTYAWPTTTTTSMTDLSAAGGDGVFDPLFSWAPIPGAARYQVEVNAAAGFPAGSKWCCTTTTLGTSFSPTQVLGNNVSYYWRVRAIDENGNAGVWNVYNDGGPPFNEAFDNQAPTIPNLAVVDPKGSPVANSGTSPVATQTPIVTWSPVPGASRYEVQYVPYTTGNAVHCDWSLVGKYPSEYEAETATTAWTPLGTGQLHIGPTAWPTVQQQAALPSSPSGIPYCLRVLARSDNDAMGNQVVSDWTQINGSNEPAFAYQTPGSGTASDPFVTPGGGLILPADQTITLATPLFSWNPVAGAHGYYIVISRDATFTNIADIGFTNATAYAPRLANDEPLRDQTTAYYWTVIPAETANGTQISPYQPCSSTTPQPCNAAQRFTEQSIPPTPVAPAQGAQVSTQPTFMWAAVRNARNYTLQVSADSSFGNPIDNVTTDSLAYTSNSTYPANLTLYWRVRANDWSGHGLNWSVPLTFVRTLPVPLPSPSNATSGQGIPVLNWAPVQGATGYDVHVDWVDGTTSNYTVKAPAITFSQWNGVGVWRWQVRADFPTSVFTPATSAYSPAQEFVRLLNAPSGARGVKTGTRLVISWNADSAAKSYEVDVSRTDGFANLVETHRTQNTSWAAVVALTTAQTRGKLYWRVAAIDQAGNVGTFATGSFGHNPSAKHNKNTKHKKTKQRTKHRKTKKTRR
jgi:hypothetical protein